MALAWVLTGTALPLAAQPIDVSETAAREALRQEERERQRRARQEVPDVRLPRSVARDAPLPEGESPCFPVTRIRLAGEDAARFAFALDTVVAGEDPAIGRCLGTRGIERVLTRVQNAIIIRGYVTTRVLVAPQDLATGELILTVIPGRVRTLRWVADRPVPPNALPLAPGALLDLRDLEQGLENFERVPSADADFEIAPASGNDAQPGESDLIVHYRQDFPLRLTLSVDDGGAKATGKYQGAVTLSLDNPLSLNDLFYVSLNRDLGGGDAGARGTRGHSLHYSVPYGYWLLAVAANAYAYRQTVAAAAQNILYRGTARNYELQISRVVYRDAVRKTTASARAYLKESRNYIEDVEIEIQRRRTAGYELLLAHREFIGAAILDARVGYRHGTGAFGALPAPEETYSPGASRPVVVTTSLGLDLPLTVAGQTLRYRGELRAQSNRTPLVPQERFAIGGRYTVRGFDGENVLAAERGWLLRNDFGVALPTIGSELYAGLDHGEVGGPTSASLLGRQLTGLVVGLRGGFRGFSYDVFAGRPLSKPEGFRTAATTAGFNLSWTL